MIHKKGKENSKTDAHSRSSHIAEAPPLEEDEYAKFYEIDEPVIKLEEGAKYAEFYEIDEPVIKFEGVNEIQHIQHSLIEIAEEQAKDKVWSEVISWIEQG